MTKLGDLYSDFLRIDLDAKGAFARVADVNTQGRVGIPQHCAFKVMRHEHNKQEERSNVTQRFENEVDLLIQTTNDPDAPEAITRIYDCGFVPVELSFNLQNQENPNPNIDIYSAKTNLSEFRNIRKKMTEKEKELWLPYLTVELAGYDDSLLRQINAQPKDDRDGLFRIPTGDVIAMSFQLLDAMQYLHTKFRLAYMDWKPEHIYWNAIAGKAKLIDWNVTAKLDDSPGEMQNIKDDIRLFCGAVLYIGLTFVNPENPAHPIGPRPTKELLSPVPEIRRRYWTDNPQFYQRGLTLDESIKQIIRKGINPRQGFDSINKLKSSLLEYAETELGIQADEFRFPLNPVSPYLKALYDVHQAQKHLHHAQNHLYEAIAAIGAKPEFTRLHDAISSALTNFPVS